MTSDPLAATLVSELDEALALLDGYRKDDAGVVPEPLPSLLQQCEALCADFAPPEPVRCLHHLACSGGTRIARTIAALPNVVLLNEIDPLSRLGMARPGERPRFAPSDVIHALKHAARPADRDVLVETFRASIASAAARLEQRGLMMVLRAHSHSQFCTLQEAAARPTVRDMLRDTVPTLSLVTIRHPLHNMRDLRKTGRDHFRPSSLEEYSHRVTEFLDRHDECPILRSEDFAADPEAGLDRICRHLALPHDGLAVELGRFSGLRGEAAQADQETDMAARGDVPGDLEAERDAIAYTRLCERLGYEP